MPFDIHRAADRGDLARVRALLDDDPDLVLSADPDGRLPLHDAAAMGHTDVVKLLLTKGAGAGGLARFFKSPLRTVGAGRLYTTRPTMATRMWPTCCWPQELTLTP